MEIMNWMLIETAPRDGTDIVLLAHGMEIEARFCPGEWSEHHEYGREYNGAVWSAFDDALQFEVEETEEGYLDGPVTHWRPKHVLPTP